MQKLRHWRSNVLGPHGPGGL